jgi:hypothetical protein
MQKLNLRLASISAAGAGVICLLIATFFDTAPEGTHNIGLMQVQMLWSNFSSVLLVTAAILFVGHHLGARLEALSRTP